MSALLRAAVIGAGHLGRFHAQKYKALGEVVELVGVCDLELEQAQKVGSELGVKAYGDFRELIGKVDLVTIAATTSAHYSLCQAFLEAGVHVHVEKPIATTSAEARELCVLADKKGCKFQVGHVERFNPALISAREQLGAPLFMECHRLAPFKPRGVDVDVVLDLMIHDIDVILSLVKSKVSSVSAVGTPVLTQTSDIANARIEFENGAIANMTASRVSQRAERKFRVFQDNQYLSIDFGSGEVNLLTKTGDWKDGEIPLEAEAWSLEKGDALLEETRSFVNSVKLDQPCVVSGWDGLVALEIAEEIISDLKKRRSRALS